MGTMKPTSPSWVHDGFLRTSSTTDIDAPADRVWKLVTDATMWTAWHASYSEFAVAGGSALDLDSTFQCKELIFNNEGVIHAWEPGRAVGLTFTRSTFSSVFSRYAERIEITPIDRGRCSVTHSGRISPAPLGWLLAGYVLGQAVGAMYFDYRSSTKKLGELAELATTDG